MNDQGRGVVNDQGRGVVNDQGRGVATSRAPAVTALERAFRDEWGRVVAALVG